MPPVPTPSQGQKRPKGNKRERTRATLLEATRQLIREKGYEHTTMQDVARRAGMTIGAIYGNFRNRDELFLALADAYWAPIHAQFKPGSSFADKMQALAQATLDAIPDRSAAAVGALSGRAYALRHPDVLARVHQVTAKAYADGAAWVRAVAKPEELPMSPDLLVRVVHALTDGLLFQRILTPELVPDEVFLAAFALLAVKREPKPR